MLIPDPWTSERWAEHFRRNREESLSPDFDDEPSLTSGEKRAIAASVQAFQLGENSEGRNLLRVAKVYAERHDDPAYVDAIRLFIAEEQRHALYLAKFMKIEGIPQIKKNWTDSVFRWLRKLIGLEVSISVLLVAEIIAKVYYVALRDATQSPLLRRICEQILDDEDHHVRFQCERLSRIRREHSGVRRHTFDTLYQVLYFGTCFVVWQEHRWVFRAGCFGFRAYWRSCRSEFSLARRAISRSGKVEHPIVSAQT